MPTAYILDDNNIIVFEKEEKEKVLWRSCEHIF